MKKAKSENCSILYTWNSKILVRNAFCPVCGSKLKPTTYLLQGYNHSHREPIEKIK